MKITEKNIPELIRNGKDQQVLNLLYKTIFPKVKKYIVYQGGIADDASDAFQDAIMYLYHQIITGKYDEEKYNLNGYLFRLAINRWINKLNKHRKTTMVENVEDSIKVEIDEDRFQFLDNTRNEEDLLRKLFSDLGEKCIKLLNLNIYYDMLMEDVAIRLGFSSVGAAKMQLKRCKEKLSLEVKNRPELLKQLKNELS